MSPRRLPAAAGALAAGDLAATGAHAPAAGRTSPTTCACATVRPEERRGARPLAAGASPSTAPSRCGAETLDALRRGLRPVRLPAARRSTPATAWPRRRCSSPAAGRRRCPWRAPWTRRRWSRTAPCAAGGSGGARPSGGLRPACGGRSVAIVDPGDAARAARAGRVGEIWVAGPERGAAGYWGRPEETAATFGARLRGTARARSCAPATSASCDDGELFVTGRLKDLIIIRGRNHYPQDIEQTAEPQPPGAARRGAARPSPSRPDGEERLVVVQEVARQAAAGMDVEEVGGGGPPRGGRGARGAGARAWSLVRPGRRAQDLQRQGAAPGLPGAVPGRGPGPRRA